MLKAFLISRSLKMRLAIVSCCFAYSFFKIQIEVLLCSGCLICLSEICFSVFGSMSSDESQRQKRITTKALQGCQREFNRATATQRYYTLFVNRDRCVGLSLGLGFGVRVRVESRNEQGLQKRCQQGYDDLMVYTLFIYENSYVDWLLDIKDCCFHLCVIFLLS